MPFKKSTRWLLTALLAILLGWLYLLLGPNPEIIVSKETTHITTPLRPDGLPDFAQAIRERQKRGVTPENNAAVLFWQAMGDPSGEEYAECSREQFEAMCHEIGLEDVPEEWTGHEELYPAWEEDLIEWLKAPGVISAAARKAWKLDDIDAQELRPLGQGIIDYYESFAAEVDSRAYSPWKSEELPVHADWVEMNKWRFEILLKASERSRWYCVFPPEEEVDLRSDVFGTSVPLLSLRSAVRSLNIQSMQHLGEGRYHAAWYDLRAILTFSNLMLQSGTLSDHSVAPALRGIVAYSLRELLAKPISASLAREILSDLTATPKPNVQSLIDMLEYERLRTLERVTNSLKNGRWGDLFYEHDPDSASDLALRAQPMGIFLNRVSVDPNPTLSAFNTRVSASVALLKKRGLNDVDRLDAAVALSQQDPASEPPTVGDYLAAVALPSFRAGLAAQHSIEMLAFREEYVLNANLKADVQMQLAQVAAALAAYRIESGEYPKKLESLVPKLLAKLPVGSYSLKPFGYRLTEDGYLLYAYGENCIDDGGSSGGDAYYTNIFQGREIDSEYVHNPETGFWQELIDTDEYESLRKQIPAGADDISLRMPPPYQPWPWEMQPPSAEESEMGMGL